MPTFRSGGGDSRPPSSSESSFVVVVVVVVVVISIATAPKSLPPSYLSSFSFSSTRHVLPFLNVVLLSFNFVNNFVNFWSNESSRSGPPTTGTVFLEQLLERSQLFFRRRFFQRLVVRVPVLVAALAPLGALLFFFFSLSLSFSVFFIKQTILLILVAKEESLSSLLIK